ncbi:MAG: hypothetical protein CMJ31_04505 [Phycisphaerae bacterium]|nr:hypothetical protein [Phycisphaerae bacterium]|tara:strand:- start:127 stop:441 length:315 start_codon:yes stop_codon:yes gene_type:complete
MPSIEQLEKLLAADPNDAFVLYGLAQEHAKNGDHETAIGFFDRCLGVDPLYTYAYFHKARSQEADGDVTGAAETLRFGLGKAREAKDDQAIGEIGMYLDSLGAG